MEAARFDASRSVETSPAGVTLVPGLARASRVAARLVTVGLVALAAFVVLSTLYFTVLTHSPVPQADEWHSLALYDSILREGHVLQRLFQPHNEHRLFFPRLVLFSDYRFFGGSGRLDKAVIVSIQALEAGLFVWLVRRAGCGRGARWALGAVVTTLLFSLYQSENFEWAFQVQFVGVFASAALCVTSFALGLDRDRAGRRATVPMAAAGLLALVATFSMANGLLTGLVLVVLAALARARAAILVGTAAVASGLIVAFSIDYQLEGRHEGVAELLGHIPRLLAFTAGYLGNFADFGLSSQVAFGAFGLAATAAIAGVMAVGRDRDPARLALLGIALFAVGSAAVTAAGRSADGLGEIASSRYSTGAATFWAATLVNAWSLSLRSRQGAAWRAAACLAGLVLMQACWRDQIPMGIEMERRTVRYDAMEDALLLGLVDEPALAAFDEPVGEVREMAPVLRGLGLSIFAERDAGLIGRPLAEVEAPGGGPMRCAGRFDIALAVPALGLDGVAVSGLSSLRPRLGRPGRVYIVDADRRVVGFAHTGFGDGRWTGYAEARPGTALSAYALSDAGRSCALGSAPVAAAPGPADAALDVRQAAESASGP